MRGDLLAIVLLAGAGSALAQPKYVLDRADEQTVVATATYELTAPRLRAAEWVLFAAVAPEHDGQKKVKTTLSPMGTVLKDGDGRAVLRARVPVKGRMNLDSITTSVTYEATLVRRTLRELEPGERPPAVPNLTAAEKKQYLAATTQIDFREPAFKRWAEKLPAAADPVEFARVVFDRIRESATYEYKPDLDRRASEVCRRQKSDCGGMSTWFVATMRWKGIPARMRVGRWATSADGKEKLDDTLYYQWHVTAEFHAPGVGWVPVDVTQAVTAKDRAAADSYFGSDRGNFLTFHFDSDLKLDTIHFGVKSAPFLQNIPYWAKGEGTIDGLQTKQTWVVKKK